MLSLVIVLLPVFLIFLAIIGLLYCFKKKVKIHWYTFIKKGIRGKRGQWGIYCYTGAQGKGKTMSLVAYLFDNQHKSVIYSNVLGLKNIEGVNYYVGFKELLQIKDDLDNKKLVIPKDKQLVIVFDEIFTELMKSDKITKPVLDFLCQMRKRKIIFLTTAQYWGEIPLTFRRFCRYQIDCNMINFGFLPSVIIKTFHDAENMKWDNEEQDFVAPITETAVCKVRKIVANSYDTFMRVSSVNAQQTEVLQELPSVAAISASKIKEVKDVH